jgi:hypothetical protein
MNATSQTHIETAQPIADMNGPLAYWGPTLRPAAAQRSSARQAVAPVASINTGLGRLARTLHGRTWTGTTALMSQVIDLPIAA